MQRKGQRREIGIGPKFNPNYSCFLIVSDSGSCCYIPSNLIASTKDQTAHTLSHQPLLSQTLSVRWTLACLNFNWPCRISQPRPTLIERPARCFLGETHTNYCALMCVCVCAVLCTLIRPGSAINNLCPAIIIVVSFLLPLFYFTFF